MLLPFLFLTARTAFVQTLVCLHKGGCDLDKTYDGPKLAVGEDGKYQINVEFIKGMIEWFKAGKTLPRRYVLSHALSPFPLVLKATRYVWEIVLGAHAHFAQEQSLVNLDLEDGMTCDVIGDVHGTGEAHL